MPWARVSDEIAFSPKIVAAGNLAVGVWIRLVAWCNLNLTDGIVSRKVLWKVADGSRWAIKKAVDSGLLDELADGTYRVHDFLEWNIDAATVRANRERVSRSRAAAGRLGGLSRASKVFENGRRTVGEREGQGRAEVGPREDLLAEIGVNIEPTQANAKQSPSKPPKPHPTPLMNKEAAVDSKGEKPSTLPPPLVDVTDRARALNGRDLLVDVGNFTSDGKLTVSGFHERMINLGIGMLSPKWSPLVESLAPFGMAEVEAAVARARETGGKVVPGLVLRILERWRTEPLEQPKAPAAGSEWQAGRAREVALVKAEREHRKPECGEAERGDRMSAGVVAIGDILATVLGGKG